MLSIIILNYIFSPLIAFTIYFCFLHSIRHIISISYELNKIDFSKGVKTFVRKALPLTIITAILYLFATLFLSKFFALNDVIIMTFVNYVTDETYLYDVTDVTYVTDITDVNDVTDINDITDVTDVTD